MPLLAHGTLESVVALRELRSQAQALGTPPTCCDDPESGCTAFSPYPAIDQPGFEQRLLGKLEFAELVLAGRKLKGEGNVEGTDGDAGDGGEGEGAAFRLTRAQRVVRNFLAPGTPYNGILLYHGVGVGKTCAAITLTELYARRAGWGNGITIVTRRSLIDGFRRTVFDPDRVPLRADGAPDYPRAAQCTGTTYPDLVRDRELLTPEQVAGRILRRIKESYRFHTPTKFANVVAALTTDVRGRPLAADVADHRLQQRFDSSVLVVDEAHVLRGADAKPTASALRRVLQVARNVKLVLLTATPIFNHASDILSIVNLLLLNDRRPPLSLPSLMTPSGKPSAQDADKLAAAVRGYVSFVPAGDPLRFPRRLSPAQAGASVPPSAPELDVTGAAIPRGARLPGDLLEWMVGSKIAASSPQRRAIDALLQLLREQTDAERKQQQAEQAKAATKKASASDKAGADADAADATADADEEEPEVRLDLDALSDDALGMALDEEMRSMAETPAPRTSIPEDAAYGPDAEDAAYGPDAEAAADGFDADDSLLAMREPRSLDPRQKRRVSKSFKTLSALMQAENVVFAPQRAASPGAWATSVGMAGFRQFFKTSGRTVTYRDGAERILSPGLLPSVATKLAAVVDSVLACEGVAIVYSRYVYSGLLPLAVALEHRGMRRFGLPPLLSGAQADGGKADSGKQDDLKHYAIISSSPFASPLDETLAALNDVARNRDGQTIRVVLISDKGSEGITIKNAREVHVLEPWYHLNKVEQVVGRGARLDSHAALPPEKQNVTVFLHSTVNGGAAAAKRETLDLRMYRSAATKQVGMDAVSAILQRHAFDCNLYASAAAAERGRASTKKTVSSVDVRMSTGRRLKLPALRPLDLPLCSPSLPAITAAQVAHADRSTFDPRVHDVGFLEDYRDAIAGHFRRAGTVHATYDVLWRAVREALGEDVADASRMHRVLREMLDSRAEFRVAGAASPAVFLIHRGDRYMLQPARETSTYLTDDERAGLPPPPSRVSLLTNPTTQTASSSEPSPPVPASAPEAAREPSGVDVQLGRGAFDRVRAAFDEARGPTQRQRAAVDAAVDRLPHAELLALAAVCLRVLQASGSKKDRSDAASAVAAVVRSLEDGGVLDARAASVRTPHRPSTVYRVGSLLRGTETISIEPEEDPEPKAPSWSPSSAAAPPAALMAVSPARPGAPTVFKVLDAAGTADKARPPPANRRGGVRQGSVCFQNTRPIAQIRADMLERLTAQPPKSARKVPKAAVDDIKKRLLAPPTKRPLCEAFEALLREHRPELLLRPHQAHDYLRALRAGTLDGEK